MNDNPDAGELLAIARETLLEKLLPHLPDELRYDALMIANAMAIAVREQAAGDAPAQAELARVQTLLATCGDPPAGASLTDCNDRLATHIRSGRFDNKERAALLDHLEKSTADKLAVANPKALTA